MTRDQFIEAVADEIRAQIEDDRELTESDIDNLKVAIDIDEIAATFEEDEAEEAEDADEPDSAR